MASSGASSLSPGTSTKADHDFRIPPTSDYSEVLSVPTSGAAPGKRRTSAVIWASGHFLPSRPDKKSPLGRLSQGCKSSPDPAMPPCVRIQRGRVRPDVRSDRARNELDLRKADLDEQIVEARNIRAPEVRRIVVQLGARVVAHRRRKHIEQ